MSSPSTPSSGVSDETWTVGRLLDWTRERFNSVGIESPRVDAEHLLSFALGCSRMSLYVEHGKAVNGPERARFRELVKRRLAREPVAYIEGRRGFHALDLELSVDRRVLIPRPETELLVDWMLEELPPPGGLVRKGIDDLPEEPQPDEDAQDDHDADGAGGIETEVVYELDEIEHEEPHETEGTTEVIEPVEQVTTQASEPEPPPDGRAVLDVGTGSGAIALAIKRARPSVRVVACDVSEGAVEVARANAERLELDVEVLRSDLLAHVAPPPGGWAAIAANLPYVREPVWRELAPEVRAFEPRLALDGGEDGLDVIRRLVAAAPEQLAPGAALYLEIGFDQGESVPALLTRRGFVDVAVRRDHAGHPRIVRGRWPS